MADDSDGGSTRSMTVEERERTLFREVLDPAGFLLLNRITGTDGSSYTAGLAVALLLTDVMEILSRGDIAWFLEKFLEKVPNGHRYREHRERLKTLRHELHHNLSLAESEVIMCTSPSVHLLPTVLGTTLDLQNFHADVAQAVRMYFSSAREHVGMRRMVEEQPPYPHVRTHMFPSGPEPGTTTP